MSITKTINTATVTLATVEVKDGKPETRTSDINDFVKLAHVEQ